MNSNFENRMEMLVKRGNRRRLLKRVVALMSAVVMLFTVNTLKRTATTLERIPMCGFEYEHTHVPECFDELGNLICGLHEHTDACYQQQPVKEAQAEAVEGDVDEVEFDLGGEAPEQVEEDVETEQPAEEACVVYGYELGAEAVRLSDIIAAAELPVALSDIEIVGMVDGEAQDWVSITPEDGDYIVRAAQDFAAAELAVVTAEDIQTVMLLNGVKVEEIAEETEETVEEITEEIVEETVEQVEEETAGEIVGETTEQVEEAAEEAAGETVKENVENTEEVTEEATGETVEQAEEATEEITEEITEETVGQTEEAAEETPVEVTEETAEEVTEEVTEETTEETVEPTEETAEETPEEIAEEVAEETAEQTEEVTEEVAEEVTEKTTEETAEPTEETTEETVEETPEESDGETVEQTEEVTEEDTEETIEETSEEDAEADLDEVTGEAAADENAGEADAEEETEQVAEAAPEIAYPAQSFEGRTDSVKVSVTAAEGAFPEGATMVVADVEDEQTLSDIEQTVGEDFVEVKRVHAVDISFYNAEGEEIEPLIPISVVMTVDEIEQQQDAVVVHVDSEGAAEVVEQSEAPEADGAELNLNVEMPAAPAEETAAPIEENIDTEDEMTEEAEPEDAEVRFEADSFSVYAVVVTETIETRYIDASGATWNISVGYGPEAGIPGGATLAVRELEGEESEDCLAQTAELLKGRETITLARFFDITILDEAGNEVQPAEPVKVDVALAEGSEDAVKAVHFAEEGLEVIEASQEEDAVRFEAEGFSVYGIVYTVDFHYGEDGETYAFTLPGGGAVGMRELAEALHLTDGSAEEGRAFVENISSVAFSDQGLVKVVPVEMNMTVGALKQKWNLETEYSGELTEAQIAELNDKVMWAPDWALVSMKPFDTEETLTIALRSGETITITVTDAQLARTVISASGEAYEVTVTYGEDAAIPEGAALKVREILPGDEAYANYLEGARQAAFGEAVAADETDAGEEGTDAEQAEAAADGYARFFDIEIWADDQKIEPNAAVTVDIRLADAPQTGNDLKVVHFDEEDGPVVMQTEAGETGEDEAAETANVRFKTGGFSVYAVVTDPSRQGGIVTERDVTLSFGSYYVTAGVINASDNDPTRLASTTEPSQAAKWRFESASEDGKYYIYTMVNGQKQYINISRFNNQKGNVTLSSTPMALNVNPLDPNNPTNREYRISGGNTFYLNAWGGGNSGFAAYYTCNGTQNGDINVNYVNPIAQNGGRYIVLVNYPDNSNDYYMVNSDASLTKVVYNPDTNKVYADNPVAWTVQDNHIYFNTEATGYWNNMLASGFYRRYLNPASDNAITEETEKDKNEGRITFNNPTPWRDDTDTLVYPYEVVNRDPILTATRYSEYNYHIWAGNDNDWNGGKYFGIMKDANGVPVRLVGNQGGGDAVNILFADATNIPQDDNNKIRNHQVDHIDISISGDSEIDVPLAYGTYYYKDDDDNWQEYHVTTDVTLPLKNDNVQITPEDMKRATVKAYRKDGTELDDAFIITGYSANAHTQYSTVQVRIEGRFKVADLLPVSGWDVNNESVRHDRLANKITYVVSATKPITFPMADLEHGQLYQKNADGTYGKLEVSLDIEMAASFDYWDERNECPPIRPIFNGQDNTQYRNLWKDGAIDHLQNSGMDFVLGGNAEAVNNDIVALEINKLIVDESGKLIKPDPSKQIVTTMEVWRNEAGYDTTNTGLNKDKVNSVGNLNFEGYQGQMADYSGYSHVRDKQIVVGKNGVGQVYDYAVKPGLFYINEKHDEKSLPRVITDADGKTWEYKETYIKTEYVRRGNTFNGVSDYDKEAYPDPMHYSQTYTESDANYRSVPEVLGRFTPVSGENKKSGFLEFYVYNVYVNGTKLEVEKQWDNENNLPPEGAEVTMELRYAKRPVGSTNPWPDYDSYEPVRTADGEYADGFADSKPNTAISLTGTLSDKTNWKGAFSGLPETITVDNQSYEVDYYAVETAVKVNGVDVTDQYQVMNVVKDDPAQGETHSDGKVTITNGLRPLKVTKRWFTRDGVEYTPASAADRNVRVTAEVWKRGTSPVNINSYKVTINAKKSDDSGFRQLWSGYVKRDSAFLFSVGANKTSELKTSGDGTNCSVSTGANLTRMGKQGVTYKYTTTGDEFYKKDANIYRVRITGNTDISVTFPSDKVTKTGIGAYIMSMDAVDGISYVGMAEDESKFEDVELTDANNWTQSWAASELDPKCTYYIKVDTIRESNTGDRFVLTGPEVTKDSDGTNVISLRNTSKKEHVRLDVVKAWTGTAPENAQVTLELYYFVRQIGDVNGMFNAESIAGWPRDVVFGEEAYKPVAGSPLFTNEALAATQIILNGSEETPWHSSFEQLPKTVEDDQGNEYEVDYAVCETSVVVDGKVVTGKYTKTYSKVRPEGDDETDSNFNGTAQVTNEKETVNITVKKQWLPQPTEDNASVTVELHRYAMMTKGSVVLTLTDQNGNPVKDALIYLWKDGQATSKTGRTGANGQVSFTGLEAGEYYLYEPLVPTGYVDGPYSSEHWTVVESTEPQPTTQISMTNNALRSVGTFTLYLTDEVTGAPIQGAGFRLLKGDVVYAQGYSTDPDGKITFQNLPSGNYRFEQTQAATGYMMPSVTTSAVFNVPTTPGRYSGVAPMTNKKIARGEVTLTLTDPAGTALSGGRFTLYKDDVVYQTNLTTGVNGKIEVDNLPAGSYRFEQTQAPGGYDATTEELSFKLPENGKTDNGFSLTAVNREHEEIGDVSISLWTKDGLTNQYSWNGSFTGSEGLMVNTKYMFAADIEGGLYPNGLWLYVMEGDIDPNGTFLSGNGVQADQLPDRVWQAEPNQVGNATGRLTFSFTPTKANTHYNLVLATDRGNRFITTFAKTGVAESTSGSRPLTMAAPQRMRMATEASYSGEQETTGASDTPATSNVTTAEVVAAPTGYMEDSTFPVSDYTYTITRNDADWQHSFAGLDKYDADGNPYYYYVVETECNLDYYDLTGYSGSVNSEGGNGDITVTNEAKRGNLTLTKTLAETDPAGDTNKSFNFTITFSGDKAADMAGKTYAATGAVNSVTVTDSKTVSVSLKAGQSVTLENLPYGVGYTVTEAEDPAYEVKSSVGTSGTVVKTTNASFENRRVVGQIDVTKTVKLNGQNNANAAGKTFWVGLFTNAAGTSRVAGQADKEITIGADGTGTQTFDKLPVGTYYVYELTAENGSAVTGSSATIGDVQYSVTTDNTGAVITKSSTTGRAGITNNETSKGSLTVKKRTLYNQEPDRQAAGKEIKVGLYKKVGNDYVAVKDPDDSNMNWVKKITLSANGDGEVAFPELEFGTYTVYEIDDQGNAVTGNSATINSVVYTVSKDKTEVALSHEGHKNDSITITNSATETGSLAVTKEIQVNGKKANLSGKFKVALYKVTTAMVEEQAVESETRVGDAKTITVTNGESTTATFANLDIGGTYRVYEVTVSEDEETHETVVTKAGNRFGQYTVSYDNQTVTIPRRISMGTTGLAATDSAKVINNIETTTVKVDKKWFQPNGTEIENIRKASISVQLKNGDALVAQDASGNAFGTQGTVSLPAADSWKYEWTNLPKYGAEGQEINYTVVETSAKLGNIELLSDGETKSATRDTNPEKANEFHLENTLPETGISVTKQWKDGTVTNADRVFSTARNIFFTLYRQLDSQLAQPYTAYGTEGKGYVTYTPATGSQAASWNTVQIDHLPKYEFIADEQNPDEGTWYTASYYVKEDAIDGVQITYQKGAEEAVSTGEAAIVSDSDVGDDRTITIINKDVPIDLNIVKVDSTDMETPLAGAEFEICRVNERAEVVEGDAVKATTNGTGDLTADDGVAIFEGLVSGYYKVTETKVPDGYVLTGSKEFYIKVDIGAEKPIKLVHWTNIAWVDNSSDPKLVFETNAVTGEDALKVGNTPGARLPSTGGMGTGIYYALGTLLVLAAVALMIARRRAQAEE